MEEKQIEVLRAHERGIYMHYPHPLYEREKSKNRGYPCYRTSPFEWNFVTMKWVDIYQPISWPPVYEVLKPEDFGLSPDGPRSNTNKPKELKELPKTNKKIKKQKLILSTSLPINKR
jgi:hypothetical protein